MTDSSTTSISNSEIKITHISTITADHHGKPFVCSITSPGDPFYGKTTRCSTGKIKVELAYSKFVTVVNGTDAFLSCKIPYGDSLMWTTERASQVERLNIPIRGFATLHDVDFDDNDTSISCTAVRSNIKDHIRITVVPEEIQLSSTKSLSDVSTTTMKQMTTYVSDKQIIKETLPLGLSIIAVLGGSTILLMGLTTSVIIWMHCRRRQRFNKRRTETVTGGTSSTAEKPDIVNASDKDVYIGLNMKDMESREYASLQNHNQESEAANRISANDTQEQIIKEDTYSKLNVAEVQQAQYASLNCNPLTLGNEEDNSCYADLNLNLKANDTYYEVSLASKMSNNYTTRTQLAD